MLKHMFGTLVSTVKIHGKPHVALNKQASSDRQLVFKTHY
jgi:hypothetical protein